MRSAIWNLGFRPFYLGAAIFAAISAPLWALQIAGYLPFAYLTMPAWHGHEMLVGFALAVVAGFLLTAVRNWTGLPTPEGGVLAGIFALWVAGRLAMLGPWPVAAGVLNAAFPLAVAAGIAVPLIRSGNRRNYFFLALLVGMSAAIAAVHLAMRGAIGAPARVGLVAGLDVVLFIVSVIGGRVIPMFTNNGVPGAGAERHPMVERAALGSVLAILAADVFQVDGMPMVALFGLAAVAHAWRLALWHPLRTLDNPLVWILHAAYGWIVVFFVLRLAAVYGVVPESLALHALTLGVIGGMTIGMMTRTARGHTGRPLLAGSAEVVMYVLVLAAAVVRVFGGMLAAHYMESVICSAALWSAAYALYAISYGPYLARPRVDGKAG